MVAMAVKTGKTSSKGKAIWAAPKQQSPSQRAAQKKSQRESAQQQQQREQQKTEAASSLYEQFATSYEKRGNTAMAQKLRGYDHEVRSKGASIAMAKRDVSSLKQDLQRQQKEYDYVQRKQEKKAK